MKIPTIARPVEPRRGDAQTLEEFALSRGFDPQFLAEHGIYLAEEDETPYGGRWIGIPYRHLSGEWFVKYRRPEGQDYPKHKYWIGPPLTENVNKGSGRNHLYNPLLLGPNADVVWLTEGEFDALALISLGVPAIGVPGTEGFKKAWALLFEESHIVLAFDPDAAGQGAATKLAGLFGEERVSFFRMDGDQDWNEWLRDDPDTLQEEVERFRKEHGV